MHTHWVFFHLDHVKLDKLIRSEFQEEKKSGLVAHLPVTQFLILFLLDGSNSCRGSRRSRSSSSCNSSSGSLCEVS